MREIKFRGKHIHILEPNKKLDGIWVYGYLCSENYIWSDELCGDMLVDKNTIGQYTGLKDKNGVEIYEGDIVKLEYLGEDEERPIKVGVMNFKENQWCVNSKHLDGFTMNMYTREVIGNIYENKELLEK